MSAIQSVLRLIAGFWRMTLGWQMLASTLLAVAVLLLVREPDATLVDLWLTADQQGRLQFDNKNYAAAAESFENPAWQGMAYYRGGKYAEAADSFARIGDPIGFFNRGNALMKAFEYRKAITAYEQAVAEAPDWEEAAENLALARYTLDYIESVREQSDTGEKSGIGADDVVYDNQSQRGEDTEVSRESAVEAQSAEKWMRAVDTKTAEFLRTRFLLEASRSGEL